MDRIPGSCEIIAASFSAMVMEFLNDPVRARACPLFLALGAAEVSGVKGSAAGLSRAA